MDGTVSTPGDVPVLLEELFGYPEFSGALLNAFLVGRGELTTEQERAAVWRSEFEGLVGRVMHDIRRHRRLPQLLQVFRDESLLTDEQVVGLFDFIYSGPVSHFKGELAEVFARPILASFSHTLAEEGLAPAGLEVVPGHEVFTVREGGRHPRRAWRKGPDALIVVTGKGVDIDTANGLGEPAAEGSVIAAVAEIKSLRQSLPDVAKQVRDHVQWLCCGFRIGSTHVAPTAAAFVVHSAEGSFGLKRATALTSGDRVASLCVRPCLAKRGPEPLGRRGDLWTAEIPCTKAELMEAGLRLTRWFLARIGAEVFGADLSLTGIGPEERVPNPWPEMTPEQAGWNALEERLYYLGRRGIFDPDDGPSVNRRARRTFFWLYNAMGFGYERATGEQLHFPVQHPDLPRAPADPAALRAPASDPAWRAAMAAYHDARFRDALAVFPEPGPEPSCREFWWPRNVAMAARLHARCGGGARAREYLNALEPLDRWPYPALPIEVHAVAALSHLADGDRRAARKEVGRALTALEAVGRDRDERERRRQGPHPWLDNATVHVAVLDIAAALVALGEPECALGHLTQLGGVDPWVFDYIANDEILRLVAQDNATAARLEAWKQEEKKIRPSPG